MQETSDLTLILGEKHSLLQVKKAEGVGTWIYRFEDTQSVELNVTKPATPNAAQYQPPSSWELKAVWDD
ncbi:WxL domain-containing protein [Enterococcus entomosocium]|uniref:WxL domain-containing protein n=1 Tax=Enterococcus entomosocium TaxID=3034352 RepID=UPI002648C4A2|nr:WxL domain-containing protein [Enterococcus entomosocium]